jgi:hypothetical protein
MLSFAYSCREYTYVRKKIYHYVHAKSRAKFFPAEVADLRRIKADQSNLSVVKILQ